jgi:hypothetical protein
MKIIGRSDHGFIVHATEREISEIAGLGSYERTILKIGQIIDVSSGWAAIRDLANGGTREDVIRSLRQMADKLGAKSTPISDGEPEPPVENPQGFAPEEA